MIDGGGTSRCCGRGTSEFNNFGSSLLHSWGEFLDFPVIVDEGQSWLSTDGAVSNIWVHSWRVVTPDAELLDVGDLGLRLEGQLGKGSVVIESGHGSEVLGWDSLGSVLQNEAVSVGWVSYNDGLAISLGVIIHSFTNSYENLSIILKEIGSLHTWSTWLSSNHEGVVDILESDGRVAGAHDILKKWEGAVVQLSSNSCECLLGEWEINEMQDNALLFTQEFSGSKSEKDGVGDVSCSSSDGDSLSWLVTWVSAESSLRNSHEASSLLKGGSKTSGKHFYF